MTVLMIELNEINFDAVKLYAAKGELPILAKLIARHGIVETTSEQHYDELEPWIQWVTAHTGRTYAEHGVFRLGDIIDRHLPQIWEVLEAQGFRVGAISPMNANNLCRAPAFFLPDPWTPARVTGSKLLRRLHGAIAQAVNDNASAKIDVRSIGWLLAGLCRYARPGNYIGYFTHMLGAARGRPWNKALLLDQLLADIFVREVKRTSPDFASLFLNAGAHIQHHYLFNSSVYDGVLRNPDWYVGGDLDPVLYIYQLYDRVIGDLQEQFPHARLLLATGLHQNPHGDVTFYWRLKNHEEFLRRHQIDFDRVEPRMSRDFVVYSRDPNALIAAADRLALFKAMDGRALFEIDVRDDSLFVMMIWGQDVPGNFQYKVGNVVYPDLRKDLSFVAIKNGEHDGIGYLLDTARASDASASCPSRIALSRLPSLIASACGGEWITS